MSKLHISVEPDHLLNLTRSSGRNAIKELIWNSLDADSSHISISTEQDGIGIRSIVIEDDGHGIDFSVAERIFGRIGGSIKKEKRYSPAQRVYHGKEGRGRFKAFSLGNNILFESRYKDNGSIKSFHVKWDLNDLHAPIVDDKPTILSRGQHFTGVKISIDNVNQDNASIINTADFKSDLEVEFCLYHRKYKSFDISLDGYKLQFEQSIKFSKHISYKDIDGYKFTIDLIEWKSDIEKQVYYCGRDGVSHLQSPLFIRSSIPISLYICSDYVTQLNTKNALAIGDFDSTLSKAVQLAKDFARDYLRNRIHENNREFIEELKKEDIYPYKDSPKNDAEDAQQKVFDIVAVTINNHLPDFTEHDKQSKHLTFTLLQKAIENDRTGHTIRKIITEIINLPKNKQEDLIDILETTTLSEMIDAFKEINDRLTIISELKELIYNKELNANVKERKHLHQIIKKETWIFGDQYVYGQDDTSLENVLKAYIKHLNRDTLEETLPKRKSKTLIPDICLFFQNANGDYGKFKNLIIELKKPTVKITQTEYGQICKYADEVNNDGRYPKESTVWIFYLMATDIDTSIEMHRHQSNREKGLVLDNDNIKIYIKTWGEVLNEAEARYQYIKDRLNLKITDSHKLTLIREKYKEVIPDELK